MITLRTIEIKTEKDTDALLTNLQWHTEKLKIVSLNFFYFLFKNNVSRQWLGQVDRGHRQFKLLRNGDSSEFGVRLSGIVCKGHIVEISKTNFIKIYLQPTGYVFLNNLGLCVTTIIGLYLIPFDALKEYWWTVVIWTALLILNFIYLAIDLNKTANKLVEYFEMHGR